MGWWPVNGPRLFVRCIVWGLAAGRQRILETSQIIRVHPHGVYCLVAWRISGKRR